MVGKATTDGEVVGNVQLVKKTAEAIRVQLANGELAWFPLSQIHDDSEIHGASLIDETGRLVITQWLAARRR